MSEVPTRRRFLHLQASDAMTHAGEEGKARELNAKDVEVLKGLNVQTEEWKRPMDFGGHNGSHHSATARRLCSAGYVERYRRYVGISGGSYVYRITDAGRAALKGTKG